MPEFDSRLLCFQGIVLLSKIFILTNIGLTWVVLSTKNKNRLIVVLVFNMYVLTYLMYYYIMSWCMTEEFKLVDGAGYFSRILMLGFLMCTLDGAIHMYIFTQHIKGKDYTLVGGALILQSLVCVSQWCLTMYVLVKVGVEASYYLLYTVVTLQYMYSQSVCSDFVEDHARTRLPMHIDVTTPLNKHKVRQYHCEGLA